MSLIGSICSSIAAFFSSKPVQNESDKKVSELFRQAAFLDSANATAIKGVTFYKSASVNAYGGSSLLALFGFGSKKSRIQMAATANIACIPLAEGKKLTWWERTFYIPLNIITTGEIIDGVATGPQKMCVLMNKSSFAKHNNSERAEVKSLVSEGTDAALYEAVKHVATTANNMWFNQPRRNA